MDDTTDTLNGTSVQLIRMADGTLIDPLTKRPINQGLTTRKDSKRDEAVDADGDDDDNDEVSDSDTDVDIVLRPTARRSIMDIALNPQQMAFINNVLVYTLYGLPDDEVAMQCNCTVHDVLVVRDLDDYGRMYDALLQGLRLAYSSTVNGIFADAAPKMARKMIAKTKNKSADISMAAIKDVLDRAGHRPADRVEHNHSHSFGDELVIRVIRETDREVIPTLELNRA